MTFLFKSEIIDYEYNCINAKDTVIFLHGWGGDKNSFIRTINLLRNKYNTLSITMPTTKPTVTIWTLHDYLDLILSIMQLHNITNPIIVCHSFGFRITSLMNQRNDIKAIIITGGAGVKFSNIFRKIIKNNQLLLLKSQKFKHLYKKIASPDYQSLHPINKETFKNIVNLNTKNLIKFTCPILLFWGKRDTATPLKIAKLLRKENHAKLNVVDSDHFAYIHESNYFNYLSMEFINDTILSHTC